MITRTVNGVTLDVLSPSFYTVAGRPQLEISFVGDSWLLFCADDTTGEPIYCEFASLADAVKPIAQAWRDIGLL